MDAPPPPPASSAPPDSPPAAAPWLRTALATAALATVVIALVAAGWPPLRNADRRIAVGLHAVALDHPAWTETNRVLTDWVWDPVTMRLLVVLAVAWLWLGARQRLLAGWCAATAVVTAGVQQGLKALIDRARPHWEHPVDSAHYASMPSGHAMTAAMACVLVLWVVHRAGPRPAAWGGLVVLGCVSVVGVSFTRLALGVHWMTDTLAGSLLGVALAAAAVGWWNWLAGRISRREGEPQAPQAAS